MRTFTLYLAAAAAVVPAALFRAVSATPAPPFLSGRQVTSAEQTAEEAYRALAIRDAFVTAFEGYYKYAFPKDELMPENNTFSNDYGGWGLTMVDALDTAAVMGLEDIVNQMLEFISTIDYTTDSTDSVLSLFETNIRHLAGLLSGYDVLSGPLSNLVHNTTQVDALLSQARILADTIKFGFDTPSGIPSNGLYINNRSTDNETDNNIAQVGTLVLEWTRLSDLTGDPEYGQLAQKGEEYVLNPRNPGLGEPYPGLVGIEINTTTGLFTRGLGGWVGGVDSFYEYLMKMYVYDPTRFEYYKDRWVTAVNSTITFLTSHPNTRPELTFLALYNGSRIVGLSQHLACFDGGSFILGGLALQEQRYIDFGLRLVDGCEAIYNETLTGLGPDIYRWDPVGTPRNASTVPANQTAFYERAGFYITEGSYGIGPEALESFYYAYRVTGNKKYQDYIWNAFQNLVRYCRVGSGFSVINDVNAPDGGGYANYQPSFFLAETLKYAFLAHSPQVPVQVSGEETTEAQEWVFNTECHPMRVMRNGTAGSYEA